MKKTLLLLVTILTMNCYSQVVFEKGYFINNSNQKIDCLIKNVDWRNNPTEFQYKLSKNSESKNATMKIVKEFGVYTISRYIRNTVKIDRSSESLNQLSKERDPVFSEEQLFLKVLNEGEANLYQYKGVGITRYFYSKENANIEPLIYKKYETFDGKYRVNNYFKQQLFKDLKCDIITLKKIESLAYKKNDLVNLFTLYNNCGNSVSISYDEKEKKDLFNLTIRPRINYSSFIYRNTSRNFNDANLEDKIGFGFGVELEYVLPFNKNKWAIAIEPTYQSYKSEKIDNAANVSGGKIITILEYNSIEIPVSLRHYFFLNNDSNFFMNASFVFDIPLKSSLELKRSDNSIFDSFDLNSLNNLAFGVGYKLVDKYSLEMRYQTGRDLIGNNTSQTSSYKTLSIIFGYTIF
jgi:hypothetical protein